MFRHEVVAPLFGPCREDRYLFDLYVLARAARLGYHVEEVPIHWTEVRGSKIRPIRDPLNMILGLRSIARAVAQPSLGPMAQREAGPLLAQSPRP
jgi:dolichyl-phosphate beta-glucosyltransferase